MDASTSVGFRVLITFMLPYCCFGFRLSVLVSNLLVGLLSLLICLFWVLLLRACLAVFGIVCCLGFTRFVTADFGFSRV